MEKISGKVDKKYNQKFEIIKMFPTIHELDQKLGQNFAI